jgi:hypothetical protein
MSQQTPAPGETFGQHATDWNDNFDELYSNIGGVFFPDYNATDQGVTGSNNTLKYYIDTIGSDQATIVLRHNSGSATTTYTLTTSETIPSNITLKVGRGAIISGAGTLTVSNDPDAGSYKIFGTSITITGITESWAEWWGAAPSASQAVNSAAFQAAITGSGIVKISSGEFEYNTTLYFDKAVQFMGSGSVGTPGNDAGPGTTRLAYLGTGIAMRLGQTGANGKANIHLSNFELVSNNLSLGGIRVGDVVPVSESSIKNVQIRGFSKVGAFGLNTYYCQEMLFENVICKSNYYGLLADNVCTTTQFTNCTFKVSGKYGAYITNMFGSNFLDCIAVDNVDAGLYISSASARGISFYGFYVEGNNTGVGTDAIIVTGAGGDLSRYINFYSPFLWDSTYSLAFDFAEYCLVMNPIIEGNSSTFIKVTANTQYCDLYYNQARSSAEPVTGNHDTGMFVHAVKGVIDITDQNATPSVGARFQVYRTTNSVPTTITNFADGMEGQIFTLLFSEANTTINNGGSFVLDTSTIASVANLTVTFLYRNAIWIEVGRNGGAGINSNITSMTALTQITRATGGTFDIAIGGASGDDFTVDTNKLVVEGDSGNVGIGTTTPTEKLTFGGVNTTNNTDQDALLFRDAGTNRLVRIQSARGADGNKGSLNFLMGSASTQGLYLEHDGNVGIGTTAPSEKLDVNGRIVFAESTTPGALADHAFLYAKDVAGTGEMMAADAAANETQLSSHAFELFTPDPTERYPWSFHAENQALGVKINVDMTGAIRAIEQLTGKQFIYYADIPKIQDLKTQQIEQFRQKFIKENIGKVEVLKNDAFEMIKEDEKVLYDVEVVENGVTKIKKQGKKLSEKITSYKLFGADVKPVIEIIWETKKVSRPKLINGISFNMSDGKFYKKTKPAKQVIDAAVKGFVPIIPEWIKVRL